MDVGFGLRTCVVYDAANKSMEQISADIKGFVAAGAKLPPEATDLTTVCWSVTSLGKTAARFANSVIPPGTTAIVSLGRAQPAKSDGTPGETFLSCAADHATLTGGELSALLNRFKQDTFP